MKVLTDRKKLDIALELLDERQSEEWYRQCEQLGKPPTLDKYLAKRIECEIANNSNLTFQEVLACGIGAYELTYDVRVIVK